MLEMSGIRTALTTLGETQSCGGDTETDTEENVVSFTVTVSVVTQSIVKLGGDIRCYDLNTWRVPQTLL